MTTENATILFVTYNHHEVQQLEPMLLSHGYRVHATSNPQDALTLARTQCPDLVLLVVASHGLNGYELDGYELAARLKADERTNTIPILLLVTNPESLPYRHDGLPPPVEYLTLPFQADAILARINTYLSSSQPLYEHHRSTRDVFISEEHIRLLFDAHPIAICLTRRGGVLEYANPAYCALYDYPLDSLVGQPFTVVLSPVYHQLALDIHDRFLDGTDEPVNEWQVLTRSGEQRTVLVHAARITGPDQQPRKITFLTDITPRKQAEEALRQSEERFRLIADYTYTWEYWIGPDEQYIYVSPSCERICGYPPAAFLANPNLLSDITHPDDREKVQQHMHDNAHATDVREMHFRIITRGGEERWIDHICQPVFDNNGTWLGSRASNRDITRERQAEEELRKFQRAVEQSPSSVVITDTKGVVEYVNPKFTQITGYTLEEALGKNPNILKSGYMTADTYSQLWETILAGGEWHSEFYNRRKDGEYFWELSSISPIFNPDGEITHFVAVKEDITQRKKDEEILQNANEQLTHSINELEKRNREMTMLHRMNDFLQRSQSPEEAYAIGLPFLRDLFPNQTGSLYMLHPITRILEMVVYWGEPPSQRSVATESCLAFGGGRVHMVEGPLDDFRCDHLGEDKIQSSLCVQLITRGEPLGLLHLRNGPVGSEPERDHWTRLAMMVADHFALALSNLQLREQLIHQAIYDQLTGLFNQQYLRETLKRELRRSVRHGHPIGLIMVDIDHLRRINDTHGYGGGDIVLRTIASLLRHAVRAEDIVCRFGGEEFVVVLLEASLENTLRRAEIIRNAISQLVIPYQGRSIKAVTVSMGIAAFPEQGSTVEEIIGAAEDALYRAKSEGRNQSVIADPIKHS
ncbi:MAG: PAS domain S-box protein [Chloroflexaceae bacterium]|nr:PAS domain S-box protein [Chloroflexaceae bacterium]